MSKKNNLNTSYVYSTNPNFINEDDKIDNSVSLPSDQQQLKVLVDKKQRKGKHVTIVKGYTGSDDDFQHLAKMLKTKCGVGGSAKDGEILIQGDLKEKVYDLLINFGFTKTKKIGG